MRRRANGSGSIYRLKGGKRRQRWAAVLVVGWRDGRPVRRMRCASSRAEAEQLLAEMRQGVAVGPSPTLAEWLARWLAVMAPRLRPLTLRSYRRHCATLTRLLGRVRLRDLRPSHVEEALLSLPVGPATVRGLRAVLRNALNLAVRDRLVADNAAALARLPAGPPRRQPPATAEVRALMAALEGHRLQPLALLLAATGLRLGEALGLRWSDLDLDAGRLVVRRQLIRAPEGDAPYVLAEPKTSAARRTVILAPVVVAALRAHRRAGDVIPVPEALIWTSRSGAPLAPTSVQWVLADACRRAAIRRITPHDLRRYAATVAASSGDLLAAQALLGHTSARLTSERYAAATEGALRRAAEAAQEALG